MTAWGISLSSSVVLNDGVKMPIFGLGMNKLDSGKSLLVENVVEHALSTGYRLLDNAEYYENETEVGCAIRRSRVCRSELFIVTKLWQNGYDRCKNKFKNSLTKLNLEYVDLYLIHNPSSTPGKCVETYKAMLELKQTGLVRSVGVSNFGVHHLEGLREAGLPTPSVNQIQLHPWKKNRDIVDYCRQNGIAVMGHCPLTKGIKLCDTTLKEIAERHEKTPAQILIRWSLEHGFITIPKSSNPKRIEENSDVFSWRLDTKDHQLLNAMPDWSCSTFNPLVTPWSG